MFRYEINKNTDINFNFNQIDMVEIITYHLLLSVKIF